MICLNLDAHIATPGNIQITWIHRWCLESSGELFIESKIMSISRPTYDIQATQFARDVVYHRLYLTFDRHVGR